MKKLLLLLFVSFTVGANAQFWQEINTGFTTVSTGIDDIKYVDANTIWVTAYDGVTTSNNVQKWAKTLDNGTTWTNGDINVGNTNLGISNIAPVSGTTAYVCVSPSATSGTALGGIWQTTNGGTTWAKQTTASYNSSTSFPNIVHFFNTNDGVTMGDPAGGYFEIYTTTNGGVNWTRVPSVNIPLPMNSDEFGYTGLYYTNGNMIWFGTSTGRIYKSTNKGISWTVGPVTPVVDFGGVITTGVSGRMVFKDEMNGLLHDRNAQLWETADGGATWNAVVYDGGYRDSNIAYVPGTANTYIGTGNDIINDARGTSLSEDGGHTWFDLNDFEPTPPNTGGAIAFFDCTHGMISGFTASSVLGGAFKSVHDYCIPLANQTFANNNPFIASPNPTSGLVTISGKGIANVTITDVLGKQVLNTNFTAVDNASIDMSSYNAGIYMAKVTNADGNSSTIKVVRQ